jgi:molecular chaperone DnaK (HSP70)
MKLGIDLGTTRTIVAYADRGNYPVVSFDDANGDTVEHFPSVVAAVDGALVFGFDAIEAEAEGAPTLRSFKRMLAEPDVTADTPVRVGDVEAPLLEVLQSFVSALLDALQRRSNLPRSKRKKAQAHQAVVAVPAHALAGQRFLTLEAFRRAGVDVQGLVNEPSAAGFEYAHRLGRTITARRTRVVVYDLGGGTFDASLVRVDKEHHEVLTTAGDNRLGGDDFDEALARCACQAAQRAFADLTDADRTALLSACRDAKEGIKPNTRRVSIDTPFAAVVSVEEFYDAVAPLVARSLEVMAPLLARAVDEESDDPLDEIAGVYLVGGGSGLPLVPRLLRDRFGRRVHRSPYPSAATAIGLAIAADDASSVTLLDRFSRSFGVFRERDSGRALAFDPIVLPDQPLPDTPAVVVRRRYRAAHNVGHYRFVECAGVADGTPVGDLVPLGDVRFAFDAALRAEDDLEAVGVERRDAGPLVEERYAVGSAGLIEVEIEDLETGFSRAWRLGES